MAGPLRAAGGLRARRRAPALAGGVRTPRGPGVSRAEPAGEPGAAPPARSGTEERLDAVLGGSGEDEDEAAGPGAPRGYMEYYNETSNPFAAPAADADGRGGGEGDGGGGGERPGLKKGQGTAIVTGVISIALAVLYLGLVQVMESRGNYLEPPPPEAFL